MEASKAPVTTKHDLETLLIEKCWKDPVFKKQVLADPTGMFEQFVGHKLPENFQIMIHEDDKNTLHFTVPPAPRQLAELSDEELERVAGGTELIIVASAGAIAALIATGALSAGAVIGISVGTAAAGHSAGW